MCHSSEHGKCVFAWMICFLGKPWVAKPLWEAQLPFRAICLAEDTTFTVLNYWNIAGFHARCNLSWPTQKLSIWSNVNMTVATRLGFMKLLVGKPFSSISTSVGFSLKIFSVSHLRWRVEGERNRVMGWGRASVYCFSGLFPKCLQ